MQRPPVSSIEQRGALMDTEVRELALISVIACFGLALAWAHEVDLFAVCFAAAAAFAVEAARRSV
jgi:formate dehydrogenase assembly factor FdhD